jgi:hypothetical protein
MSLHQALQGNKRKAKSPARHREAYRSRLVRLGCEVMEDRVLLSAALPDYQFTAPALVAGTTQHNAPSSIGASTTTPGGTTQRIVSNGSMATGLPAAPSFTATAVSATEINLAWTPVAGATGYLVDEWCNGAFHQIGSLGSSSTGYAVTGLSPGTTYYFNVAANNGYDITWALPQSATTLVAATAQHNAPSTADILYLGSGTYLVSGTFTDDSKLTGFFTMATPQGPVTSVDIWVEQSTVIFGGIPMARPAVHFEEDAPPPGQTGFPFSDQFTLYSTTAVPPGTATYWLRLDIQLTPLPFYPTPPFLAAAEFAEEGFIPQTLTVQYPFTIQPTKPLLPIAPEG